MIEYVKKRKGFNMKVHMSDIILNGKQKQIKIHFKISFKKTTESSKSIWKWGNGLEELFSRSSHDK